MQVCTHLMFQDGRAREAVERYVSLIPGSAIESIEGDDGPGQTITFHLGGTPYFAFDSPPMHEFGFTPSTSIFALLDDRADVDRVFGELSSGDGSVLMPVGEYAFNPHYGWCVDQHGVSWQVGLAT